jgi:acetolactate synthase regulatory subunit
MPGKLKYFAARQRYNGLTLIVNTCHHAWPYLFLALAEAHFWLSDITECSILLSRLADSLVEKNPELDHIICVISALLLSEAIEDETYHNQSGADKSVHVFIFSTPMECPKVDIDYGLMELFSKEWDRMQSNEEDALEQFQRYACVSSNIIEDVFSLDGQSWPRLIRRGFHVNSINGISRTSKQKKKQIIIQILKNTMQSLELISQCLNNYDVFTCHFIQDVHRTMLQSDNFIEVNEEDYKGNIYPVFSLIPIGRFRNVCIFICLRIFIHSYKHKKIVLVANICMVIDTYICVYFHLYLHLYTYVYHF